MIKTFKMLKKKHPDALILFRVGDFYEAYCEDAQKASEVLGVTLTKRNGKDGFYLTGFPTHALDTYLPKLIRAGVRVAICDNIDNAPKAKEAAKETPQDEYVEYEEIKTEEPQQEEEGETEKWAKVYCANGYEEDARPINGKTFTLKELQDAVGGIIEVIRLKDGRLMIVNEEGLLQGLPVNIEATNILRRDHSTTQYIVGNAIVCDSDMFE